MRPSRQRACAPRSRVAANDGERVRQKAAKLETLFRERVFGAMRAKTPRPIAAADLRLVAQALWQMAGHDSRVRLVKLWDWAGKQSCRGGASL